jgi:plasmid stability protein
MDVMSRTLQIRDLPDDVHAALAGRAAAARMSLSEYVRSLLIPLATRPTMAEMAERIARYSEGAPPGVASEILRAARDSEDRPR